MNSRTILFLEKQIGLIVCFILTIHRSLFSSGKTKLLPQKVLFVKFIEQGALVLHLPAFQEAVSRYGKSQVYICTFSSNADLLNASGFFHETNGFYLDESSVWSFVKSFLSTIWKIRKTQIDAVIDLEFFSRATAIFCYMTGISIRAGYHRYMGLQNYRGNLFTHRLSYSHYEHVSDCGVALLRSISVNKEELPALTIDREKANIAPKQFVPQPQSLKRVHDLLLNKVSQQKIVVINPSFQDQLPLRKWPEENYLLCVRAMQRAHSDTVFVFTGRKDEANYTEEFIQKHRINNAINLAGKTTFNELLTLYSISDLLLTSDSGPAHFATLTQLNTLVLFGPETPVLYAPRLKNVYVFYEKLPCSPCYNVYNNRLSPCKNNICMQAILPEAVIEKALLLLNNTVKH